MFDKRKVSRGKITCKDTVYNFLVIIPNFLQIHNIRVNVQSKTFVQVPIGFQNPCNIRVVEARINGQVKFPVFKMRDLNRLAV